MLNKIIFLVKDEAQREPVRRLKERLEREKEEIDLESYVGEEIFLLGDGLFSKWQDNPVLFLTDEKAALKMLKEEGKAVAAFLHENNKAEDLSAAVYAVTDLEELSFDSLEKAWQRLKGLPWTVLETERCTVRETTLEDVDAFYEIYAEPSITYYMEKLYEDPEEEREYTKAYIREIYGFYGYGLWTIVHRESGEVIGRAGLGWRAEFDIPELGFVIAAPFQKKGYAYEVCLAILSYGKKELGFKKVQALVEKENTASIHLCRKLGFTWHDRVESRGMEYERYLWESRI